MPLVWASYPPGLNGKPHFHAHYFGHLTRFTTEHVQHLAAIGAQEFYSWFSTPADDTRGTFARFLLYPSTAPNAAQQLRDAATIARAALEEEGRDAFLVLDGTGAINLWLPLAGAPLFDDTLAYARTFAHTLAQRHPDLISLNPNVHQDGRVHIHYTHNVANTWTIVPYSYRAATHRIATPIHWEERTPAISSASPRTSSNCACTKPATSSRTSSPHAIPNPSPGTPRNRQSKCTAENPAATNAARCCKPPSTFSPTAKRAPPMKFSPKPSKPASSRTLPPRCSTSRSFPTSRAAKAAAANPPSSKIPTSAFASTNRPTPGPRCKRRRPRSPKSTRRSSNASTPPQPATIPPPSRSPSAMRSAP